jgi:hypothetical protein
MAALFTLGQIVTTPGALRLMEELHINPASLLLRHVTGDWGEVDDMDRAANNRAVLEGGRILSVYEYGDSTVWILTEASRNATTILRPDEY